MDVPGHSPTGVTMDTYSHVMPQAMRAATADVMNSILAGRK